MGILRVYLALCVVAIHSGAVFPIPFHDGRQAVQIFYIISGFYMAMVLSGKYDSLREFYLSRLLRIYPPYWIALIVTLVVCTVSGSVFGDWLVMKNYANHPFDHNGASGVLLASISNLTILGQDWVMFLSHDRGSPLHPTDNFWLDKAPLWQYLLIPQAWSIAVELTFYACAPFLNRLRARWMLLIVVGSVALRVIAIRQMGWSYDPWTYRFFPFEIALFLLGMLAFQLYRHTESRHPSSRFRCTSRSHYILLTAILLLLLYGQKMAQDALVERFDPETVLLAFYPIWALAIPVLFLVFGRQKDDRVLGELSYPIYLIHFVIVSALIAALGHFGLSEWTGSASIVVSVLASAIFYFAMIAPLERLRHALTRTAEG